MCRSASTGQIGKISLSWTDISGEQGYRIEASSDNGVTWINALYTFGNVTQIDYELACSQTRRFRVRGLLYFPTYAEFAASNVATGSTLACNLITPTKTLTPTVTPTATLALPTLTPTNAPQATATSARPVLQAA
jgi:hypothetical protein